jgi:hypothetical protein
MILTQDGVKEVLENYTLYCQGIIPDGTNSDNLGIKVPNSHATFEAACLIAGEVSIRVRRCGAEGLIIEEYYGLKSSPKSIQWLWDVRRIPESYLQSCINKVTLYCSDDEYSKRLDYQEWKRVGFQRRRPLEAMRH